MAKSVTFTNTQQALQQIFWHSFQVYLDSPIIANGVCLRWKGYVNLEKLDGVGGFRFDEEAARVSYTNLKEHEENKNIGIYIDFTASF